MPSPSPNLISRRDFLRVGGLTFLALTPIGRGLFTARAESATKVPVFTALPYVQPGAEGRLVEGAEAVRILWQTRPGAADFVLEFGPDRAYGQRASISAIPRSVGRSHAWDVINYTAAVPGLKLGQRYEYQLRAGPQVIAQGFFTTRAPRGRKVKFLALGDSSCGSAGDIAIAREAFRQSPDFLINTGDCVYGQGLDREYTRNFFPTYNALEAGLLGAPLLRSVPLFPVLGNHDVTSRDRDGRAAADFDRDPDSLAYFTNWRLPTNGPAPAQPVPLVGDAPRLEAFRQAADGRYPRMANYSFDFGDAHVLCLDSNAYVDPTDAGLQKWIVQDLQQTDARWKLVVYHHPPFNVGDRHWRSQHMRVLCPLFEKAGVSFVLSGHEHNYQRTRPLRFEPRDLARAGVTNSLDRRIPGRFALDRRFDGKSVRKADGIIYVVTGAGGQTLYGEHLHNAPERWRLEDDGREEYVARFVSDRHSLSVFEIDGDRLDFRQVDEHGREIEHLQLARG